mgnify:FL=1
MESFGPLFTVIRDAGLMGGGAAFIWALYRGHLVWGKDHREKVTEIKGQRDEYKNLVDKVHEETAQKLKQFEDRERGRESP